MGGEFSIKEEGEVVHRDMRGGGGSLRDMRGVGLGGRGGVCVGGMRGSGGEWGRGRRGVVGVE